MTKNNLKMPAVAKTIKLFVGGKFPRSESGRSFPVNYANSDKLYANLCLSSRKDIRDTVEAATAGLHDWSGRSAFNRSQILYRMAEMAEGKRDEFVKLFADTLGMSEDKANEEVDSAIDSFVFYAGFCDKFSQIASTVNPINGPFGNTTSVEPVGVTALFTEKKFNFGRMTAQICAAITSGNSVIVFIEKNSECPAIIAPLSEVFATSDLPGGAVNLLTGDFKELVEFAAGHMDVRSLVFENEDQAQLAKIKELAIGNLKRIVPPRKDVHSLGAILDTVEYKTIWQSVGF